MPSGFGHLIIGLSIAIPLSYLSKEKLSSNISLIFVLSNWIGPDSAQAYFFIPIDFHYLIPFIFWALPLASFYSYLSRFSFKSEGYFITINDNRAKELKWRQAYLITLSGAIIHTFSDALFRNDLKIKIIEGGTPSIFDLHDLDWMSNSFVGIELIGYFLLVSVTLTVMHLFHRDFIDLLVFFLSFIVIEAIAILVLGSKFVGNEYDLAVIIISFFFVFLPLMLLIFVANDVSQNEKELIVAEKEQQANITKIIICILLIAIGTGILGIWGLVNTASAQEMLDFDRKLIQIASLTFLALTLFAGIGAAGLYVRAGWARNFVMFIFSLLILFVYPFVIVLYLAQDNVKKEFHLQ
ncbi:MAG: hypothetical protein ACXAB7_12935 [Candidatus Kariarchaeaceae archaeon]|jgi:hypothetical protein